MNIWIDADNFHKDARALVIKRCDKLGIPVNCVSVKEIKSVMPDGAAWIEVELEPQAADKYIIANCREGDLAFTRDIFLANELLQKKLTVMNDKGTVFSVENMARRLTEAEENRMYIEQGVYRQKALSFDRKIYKVFADCLDRELTKLKLND